MANININISVHGMGQLAAIGAQAARAGRQMQHAFTSAQQGAHRARLQLQQLAHVQARLNQQTRDSMKAGAASAWSPQISAVKQYQMALQRAAAAAKDLQQQNRAAQRAGLASAWSPQISQHNRARADMGLPPMGQGGRGGGGGGGGLGYGGRGFAADYLGSHVERVGMMGAAATGADVGAAGKMELWDVMLTRLMGSAAAAKKQIDELKQLDKESPFTLPGLIDTTVMMKGMGIESKNLTHTMTVLGDAVASVGGNDETFRRLAINLAQIRRQHTPMQRDLNQFATMGVNYRELVAKGQGKEGEVTDEEIDKMTGEQFVDALMKGIQASPAGGMMKIMNETLIGKLSNLESALFELKAALGDPLVPAVTALAKAAASMAQMIAGLPEPVRYAISYVGVLGTGLVIMAGAALRAAGNLMMLNFALNGTTGSAGLAGLVTRFAAVKVSIGTLIASLGGLATVMTVALPIAIAAGIALMWDAASKAIAKNSESPELTDADRLPSNTKENALARAEAAEKRADEIDARIEAARQQQRYSFDPTKSDADFDRDVGGMEAEQKSLRLEAASLRKKASTLPSAANAPDAGAAAAASAAAAFSMNGTGEFAADENEITAQENEILALKRQMRGASKEQKKVLGDQLFEKQAVLKEMKRELASNKREATAAERARKKLEQDEIDNKRLEMDVKATESEEAFNTRIAQLEAQRDEAKEAKDEAKEKQLTFEIASLQAQREYAQAMIEADSQALENEKQGDATRRKAKMKYDNALNRAKIEFNKKTGSEGLLNALRGGSAAARALAQRGRDILGSVGSGMSTYGGVNAGGMFNPYANAVYPGTTGSFVQNFRSGAQFNNVRPMYNPNRSVEAKIRAIREQADGKVTVEFEQIVLDRDDYGTAGAVL